MTLKEFERLLLDGAVLDGEDVSRKWYEIVKELELLHHLQANGVDNWEGYSRPESNEDDE